MKQGWNRRPIVVLTVYILTILILFTVLACLLPIKTFD